MFNCILCNNADEYCMTSSLCSKCLETKKIIDLYGIDRVNESLLEIFVREDRPINNRTEAISQRAVLTRSKKKEEKKASEVK